MSSDPKLTARQAAFVEAYLGGLNQTDAFIKAGYSAKTARVNAARMMANETIRATIAKARVEAAGRARIDLDRLVAEYTRLAMTGMSRFLRIDASGQPVVDLSRCTPADLDLLAEVQIDSYREGKGKEAREVRRIRIKPYNRLVALAQLARHLGLDKALDGGREDPLAALLKEIQARGSALPVKPQGPLGWQKLPWKQ